MKTLMVQGKQVSLHAPIGVRQYVAEKAGITLPVTPKGGKGITFKEVKELALAAGATATDLKAWSKEYDAERTGYYTQSALINGQLAADPTLRKAVKISVNAKGETIGAVTTYRRERSTAQTQAQKIAQLEALVASLQGRQITA